MSVGRTLGSYGLFLYTEDEKFSFEVDEQADNPRTYYFVFLKSNF